MHNFSRITFAFLALGSATQAAPIDVIYVGPAGTFDEEPTNYTVPANWSRAGVPNNIPGSTYNVTIPKAVFVDIPVTISELTITTAGSLTVKDTISAEGTFSVDGDVTNDGTLEAYNSNFALHTALTNFDSTTGTLTGGNFDIEGFDLSQTVSRSANFQFTDANVIHNGGSITIVNHASIADQLGRDGLRNLADNTASGAFVVGSGYSFVAPGNFTNAGSVTVQAATNVNDLVISAASFQVASGHEYIQTAGSTTVNGALTADLSDFQGGDFSLGGTVTGTVTAESATVSPTNELDPNITNTITGDLTLDSSTTLHFSIPSLSERSGTDFLGTGYDHLLVNGTVTLGQSTLAIDVAAGYPISSHATFTVLDSDAPFAGNFGNVTNGARLTTLDGQGSFIVTDNNQAVVLSDHQTVPPAAQFVNLSTRGDVLTNDNVLIGGFIIGGTAPKNVILRAIGPSLVAQGITTPLADPTLELHGPLGGTLAFNDNWKDTQRNLIEATGIAPTDDLESAIVTTLDPGSYTIIVRGKDGGTGTALVEIYDLATSVDSTLSNVSTRGFVDATNPLIGGFIAGGSGTGDEEIVARAIGPDLAAQGITDPLQDPVLQLYDKNGTVVASSDNYLSGSDNIVALLGLEPGALHDATLRTTLAPGAYTAVVTPKEGGSGVALVEFYDLLH